MALTRIGPNQSVNLASNVTGTLPVANGGTALTSGFLNGGTINDGTNTLSKVAFHRWKLNALYTASTGVNDITGAFNSEYAVGTAMSYSSGIWTFPYTGQWQITANLVGNSAQASSYRGIIIQATTNNSSYNYLVSGYTGQDASHYYLSTYMSAFFDVTDVSNCKVKMSSEMAATGGIANQTWVEFFYLGDT